MKPFPSEKIRNVALVGHQGAGKTTLAEALLHVAGAIPRRGRVEEGTTTCDTEPEEHAHGATLGLALAPFEWHGHKINLIDTPGYAEFGGEVDAALAVADVAVFVVSAVEGVEVRTTAIWQQAAELGLPRMIFVNKLDRERASFERTLDDLVERFGAGIAPLELPVGTESGFRGVVDLLSDRAFTYSDGVGSPAEVPEDMATREHAVHDQLVEGIVVADDAMLEGYLEGTVPPVEALERTMAVGVGAATVFPVVCGSALAEIGVDRLADFLCEIGPSPLDRPPVQVEAGDTHVDVAAGDGAETLAHVFKTLADPYVGRISLLKVHAGTIHIDDHLVNSRTGGDERLHSLTMLRGKDHEAVDEVPAGDIAAVAKLGDTATGDTLARRGRPVRVINPPVPEPVYGVAVIPRTQADEDKLATALHRLLDEDPTLRVVRDEDTHQTLLEGMGDTHLTVALERIGRRYGVAVTTEQVRVPYRETVTTAATAEGRYKKQTGGHGQFGVAVLRVEPRPAGTGLEFIDEVVGGAIPRQFIGAVRKGVEEAMSEGGTLGHPVVDVAVACVDGKHHPVDSSEMSFKMAGRLAFRQAEAEASPVLLEPISRLTVTVPSDIQGEVLGDINSRRGRVQATEATAGGLQRIEALVPRAEILRYAIDLRALTGGRGRFRAAHESYEPVPANLVEDVRRSLAEAG